MAKAPQDPKIQADPMLHRVLDDVGAVMGDTERYRGDRVLDKERLFGLLEDGEPKRKLICYLTGVGSVSQADAAPIGSMLDAIGSCDNLDLMINSPGGSGEMAEKIVEMCREHCTREFRVIVPNFAKSAATMVALGADVIVMGYPSELGPIDPQYPIVVGNVEQYVSGQSFIAAFEATQERVSELIAAGEPPTGYLQSLATSTMEPAFIEHCRRGVAFSRDLGRRFLREYHFPAKRPKLADSTIRAKARRSAENLLSANSRFSHGRLIGATEAHEDVGLNVRLLDREDPEWMAYWELYVRAEVYMQLGDNTPAKLFIDRGSMLAAF